ncbi:MAG TPA: hypothetical protein VFB38_27250 [Chthonomonadaceae bacterium]|nr:hypothetical protein [Chthonomonadaceae bacterium]
MNTRPCFPVPAMRVSSLCLFLLSCLPLWAQLPPPKPHWQITYTYIGNKSSQVTGSDGTIKSQSSSQWYPTNYDPGFSQSPPSYTRSGNLQNGDTAHGETSGTITATLRWVLNDGDAQLAPILRPKSMCWRKPAPVGALP